MATTTETETRAVNRQPTDTRQAPDAADRNRTFARLTIGTMLAWALIWMAIIASLFLFGDALSAAIV
jgi:hypothetical protein